MRQITHELPHDRYNDANWLRNLIVSLPEFEAVDIHYERDTHAEEPTGEWEINITAPGPTGRCIEITSKSTCILEALHDATTQAEKSTDEHYQAIKQRRAGALAKLTPEERRLLNLV